MTALYEINPLEDPRWKGFLENHPRSSVFHTAEWLSALRLTYGYGPVAFTLSPPSGDLTNAAVFCKVESWLTGRRLVSLPFADHCDLLNGVETSLTTAVSALRQELVQRRLQYIEIRPKHAPQSGDVGPHSTYSYCLHELDLTPDVGSLLAQCHKDSTQRKIRRAERERLTCEEGRSAGILDSFYGLLLLTRRRHRLPPQPKKWFQSLIECFGQALNIRVAFQEKQPVAAILTLRYKDVLVYKYGCSDARFHSTGGMHWLLWRSIREAKQEGCRVFDLGRSGWEDAGLIRFKDRWGARRSGLTYLRFAASANSKEAFVPAGATWKERAGRKVFPYLPDPVLCALGNFLYRHIA